MKKQLQLLATAVLLVAVSACSLFTKDIDVPQEFSLYVDRPANSSLQFSVAEDVNTGSEDVRKHQDNIEKFEVDKITFTVSNFNGSGNPVMSGKLNYAIAGTSSFKTLGSVTNADLKTLSASGQEVTVTIADAAVKNDLITQMKSGSRLTFQFDGTTTSVPVAADVNFKVYANMTVSL